MVATRQCGPFALAILLAATGVGAQDPSGPEPGKRLAPLKVFAATGPSEGKELDYVAERGEKTTVYVLIREWDRPVARFLKTLDAAVRGESAQAVVVAAWLTDEKEETKTYLPRAQQLLKLEVTPLTVFLGDKAGPNEWDVNPSARVTVVVAKNRTVTARFGFASLNETNVPPVREAVRKAVKG
jgi:hypothetical protein